MKPGHRLFLRTLLERDLPPFEMEIRVRQVLDLAKRTPIHALGNLGNGVVLAVIFWDRLSHPAILVWLGIFAFFSSVGLYRQRRKRMWPVPVTVSRSALMRTTANALVAGLLWAVAVVYAFPSGILVLQLFIIFVVGGLSAGATSSMAAQPVACLAFMTPPVAAALTLLAIEPGSVAHAMAIMSVLYVIALVTGVFAGFSSFVEIVRARFESRSLENRLLKESLAESDRSNRAKSRFLANMSHELRTPLNAVIGFSEVIRDQTLGADAVVQYRDYAGHIHEAGEHLLRIINDVLDISKIEAGKLELHEGEVDVAEAVDAAVRFVRQAAAEGGLTIVTAVPDDLPMLLADELRVKQILLNLMSNAVKFTHPRGTVTIGAGPRAEGMALWVRDTGIGMSSEEVVTAAEPFRQAEHALSRAHQGAGLGLSLVEGFARLHGGSMEIVSAPAQGTTVTVIFPAKRIVPSKTARGDREAIGAA
jgi:signal transduction histidine kinase